MTGYLERCLSAVPDSEYRLRLRQELEEHLADLALSLSTCALALLQDKL